MPIRTAAALQATQMAPMKIQRADSSAVRASALAKPFNLEDNFAWANDYPHHEGTWPHSAEAIERTMPGLDDRGRATILGLNAARFFKIDVPEHQRLAA